MLPHGNRSGWAYTGPHESVTASNPRTRHDPTHAYRHGGRLGAASPATGHHLSPGGKPHPQSPARRAPAPPDRHGTPSPRDARPSAWPPTPHRARHPRHARYPPALVGGVSIELITVTLRREFQWMHEVHQLN